MHSTRGYICNHSDVNGRYAYNMQPQIAHWNLYALGQALVALTEDVEATKTAIDTYLAEYSQAIDAVFRAKLGLIPTQPEDEALISGVMDLLQADAHRLDDLLASACRPAGRWNRK